MFQHTATRRWLLADGDNRPEWLRVSTHSHPKVAAAFYIMPDQSEEVSTHSHPKVAAHD